MLVSSSKEIPLVAAYACAQVDLQAKQFSVNTELKFLEQKAREATGSMGLTPCGSGQRSLICWFYIELPALPIPRMHAKQQNCSAHRCRAACSLMPGLSSSVKDGLSQIEPASKTVIMWQHDLSEELEHDLGYNAGGGLHPHPT